MYNLPEERSSKFNIEGMKDDFIQTKARRTDPLESQRDLHDMEGLES